MQIILWLFHSSVRVKSVSACACCFVSLLVLAAIPLRADDATLVNLWPGLAPGETTLQPGQALPSREHESPPATRVTGITQPQLEVFLPDPTLRNGTAVAIFPGGGFNYVVVDKEGAEIARWLNQSGVAAFVVRYRTKIAGNEQLAWERPLQDGQRAVSLIRSRAAEWKLQPNKIGVLGFSAGGQAAAVVSTRFKDRSYVAVDGIDAASCRPDFTMLAYPAWLIEPETAQLADFLPISIDTPPAFLIHAHDDKITSLSSLAYYSALKRERIPAEVHIYAAGGHGYGLRPVQGTNIHTWPMRAEDWMKQQGLIAGKN